MLGKLYFWYIELTVALEDRSALSWCCELQYEFSHLCNFIDEPNHYASDRGDERIVDRCNRGNKGGIENPDVDDKG